MWTLSFLVVLSLCLGVGAWLFFLWSAKSGQYDDVEGPKYRMLEDEDEGEQGEGAVESGPGSRETKGR